MSPSVYPLPWLEGTFTSRARTEYLLRPELENGTITQHDFDAAVDFYPRSHRYWPIAGMVLGGGGAFAFERVLHKPKVKTGRWGALGMFSAFTGLIVGQLKRAEAHRNFVASLENRPGFFRALENVNVRTGGRRPLGLPIEDVHGTRPTPAPTRAPARLPRPITTDDSALEPASETFSDTWRDDGRNAPPDPPAHESEPAVQVKEEHPRSRWEEIRLANARGSQQSSWDRLRQGRLNNTSVKPGQEQPSPSAAAEGDAERAQEQAKFDAMLEAERRRAESSAPSSPWR